MDPARWRSAPCGATSTIDDDTKQAIVGLVGRRRRLGLAERLRPRDGGPGRPRGPALRLRGRATTSRRDRGCGTASRRSTASGNKVANFFFSDHSQSAARATKLEKEIAYNYPDGPKPDGPARQARRPEAPARTGTVAAPLAGVPAGAQALAAAPPPPVSSAAPAGTDRREIKAGMTANEVRQLLGDPQAEIVFAREDPAGPTRASRWCSWAGR